MEQSINISQLSSLASVASEYCRLGDDYLLAHVQGDTKSHSLSGNPMRIEGVAIMLCLRGSFTMSVNLEKQQMVDHCLISIGPDKLINFENIEAGEVDFYVLFLSRQFMGNLNIDLKILDAMPTMEVNDNPVLKLTDDEIGLLESSYRSLYINTMTSDEFYRKSIAHAFVAAICYQVMQFAARRSDADKAIEKPRSRRAAYVMQFRQLVHRYHRTERSVSFYAEKMFISPKYLSLVIKETTGRTAAEWIDDYVILEAKNLLRFSGKNVQQVAYALNFPNQGSFGKYFKHLTGLSPTAYQRS